jgi:hypothetical protein
VGLCVSVFKPVFIGKFLVRINNELYVTC